MTLSAIDNHLQALDRPPAQEQTFPESSLPESLRSQFLRELHREFLNGILVFTEQEQLIYANDDAHKILGRLAGGNAAEHEIPEEISHICQSLIQSRRCFPHQNWLAELDICTQEAKMLHIRARWLTVDAMEHPCLLLVIEDRQQAVANIVMAEAKQYGLTSREKQVWMLHRSDLTYKQIAKELGITSHTVKKHMKSIHAKKRQGMPTASGFQASHAGRFLLAEHR